MKKLLYLLLAISLFSCGDLILTGCNNPVNDSTTTEKVIQPQAMAMAATVAQVCHHTGQRDSSFIAHGSKDSIVHLSVDSAYTAHKLVAYDSIVTCPPVVVAPHKTIYIDNSSKRFVDVIFKGDRALLDSAFNSNKKHGRIPQSNFNDARCYDLDFSTTASKKAIGDFASAHHKVDPNFRIGSVEQFAAAFAYNQSQTDTTRRLDYLATEREYWNTVDATGKYSASLALAAFKKDTTDYISDCNKYVGKFGIKDVDFYNGHFKDGYKSLAPRFFAKHSVNLHDYMPTPGTDYVQYRKDSLNAALAKWYAGLFSVESLFWGPASQRIGYDSCLVLQKKQYDSHHYSMQWNESICFDWEHYEYYTFGAGSNMIAKGGINVPKPKYPTNPNHLNEGKYSDN